MAKNNQRGRNNNNPEGRNQYSGGWMSSARDNPVTTAAVAAGAAAAGIFLWSRRNQISDQLSQLGEQIGEWRESMTTSSTREFEMADGESLSDGSSTSSAKSRQSSPSRNRPTGKTGAGNASMGANSSSMESAAGRA